MTNTKKIVSIIALIVFVFVGTGCVGTARGVGQLLHGMGAVLSGAGEDVMSLSDGYEPNPGYGDRGYRTRR
jgi:predicted small secreted protein